MTSFASLGITEPILTALTDYGYAEPTVIQEKAIPAGIAGRDVRWAAPKTGTGKTCAFGVPICSGWPKGGRGRTIRALILTPTRELAIQIDENLHAYGKNLPLTEAVIFGGVGQAPQVDQLKRGWTFSPPPPAACWTCRPGPAGSVQGGDLRPDEADRMLDMGFIHDVRKVIRLLPQKKQTMFFSATLPPEILDLVDTLLHDPVKVAAAPVSSPVEVIRQEVCLVDRKNKTALLLEILEQEQVKSALVFTRTKHGADKVARDLTRRGVAAAAIHGNKSQTARQESLRKFKEGKLRVLVATDIAARGLDIEELSYVFNYNLSEVPETYIHRIGRTGRAGRGGTAISFCDYGEMPMLKDIEKLLKKPIPRRAHDYPMEVFEVPVKDAKGRVVNPEDAEARQAARGKSTRPSGNRPPRRLRKRPPSRRTPRRTQPPAGSAAGARDRDRQPPPSPRPSRRRRGRRPGGPSPTASRIWGIWRTSWPPSLWRRARCPFSHRDPLEGEVIMDATARLLAAKPVYQYYKPGAAHGKRGKGDKKPKAQAQPAKPQPPEKTPKAAQAAQTRKAPKKGAPAPAKKGTGALGRPAARSGRGRGRIPPRVEPPKSRQKDSTEQKSLMKPFYIDHD